MKIAAIELYEVHLPYSGGVYLLSGGREYTGFDAAILRIETDNGIEGWGESTPFGSTYIAAHARGTRAGIEEITPHLLGRDPRQLDRINDVMDDALVGHHRAKTPFDIAAGISLANPSACQCVNCLAMRQARVCRPFHQSMPARQKRCAGASPCIGRWATLGIR